MSCFHKAGVGISQDASLAHYAFSLKHLVFLQRLSAKIRISGLDQV